MTERLRFKSWATGALVLAAVTACGHGGTDPSADPTPAPTQTSSPSPVATSNAPTSPTELAAAQATQKVKDYFAVLDRLGQDPTSPLKPLRSVATSTELTAEQHFLTAQHQRGDRQVGDVSLADISVEAVNLDNSDASAGKIPTVTIDVCRDVSDVDVIDKHGKSIVLPGRPPRAWTRFIVANYEYSKDAIDGWRVASSEDLKKAPCAAL